MPQRERMSSVDTAWLRMDSPANLMMIVGVMMLGGKIPPARFRKTIEARLLKHRRFRQKVETDATGAAYWVDDPDFDLDRQIERVKLPRPAGKKQLQDYVAGLLTEPLEDDRPPWRFHIVENYADGGSALVTRLHHCIADGIALISVLLSITDTSATAKLARSSDADPEPDTTSDDAGVLGEFFGPMTKTARKAFRLAGKGIEQGLGIAQQPSRLAGLLKIGGGVAQEIAQLALMPDDSPTRLKGTPGFDKRVAWSEPMPLAEVKAVGKALECSVNDVLLSCVAGAFRGWMEEQGDDTTGVEIRAMVPVNLRPPGEEARLGNRFGLVGLLLPVGIAHPLRRTYAVHQRMNDLKGSYQAALTLGVLGVLGYCPRPVQKQVLDTLSRKGSAVMTNVPGPRQTLYLAGAPIEQQMFWVPQSGDIGVGVSILSYAERVQFGLVSDAGFIDDPHNVAKRFATEFAALKKLAPKPKRSRAKATA